jgi:hypothetical protein
MRKVLVRLLAVQVIVGLIIAAGFCVVNGLAASEAAIYGGAVAVVVSLLLALRVSRASRPGAGLGGLYVSTFERMAFVVGAFAVGMVLLQLAPLALVIGFAGAELAYYAAAGPLRRHMLDTIGRQANGE